MLNNYIYNLNINKWNAKYNEKTIVYYFDILIFAIYSIIYYIKIIFVFIFVFWEKRDTLTLNEEKTVSCHETLLFMSPQAPKVSLLGCVQSEGKTATSKESQHPLRKFSQLCVGIAEHGGKCEAAFLFYNA